LRTGCVCVGVPDSLLGTVPMMNVSIPPLNGEDKPVDGQGCPGKGRQMGMQGVQVTATAVVAKPRAAIAASARGTRREELDLGFTDSPDWPRRRMKLRAGRFANGLPLIGERFKEIHPIAEHGIELFAMAVELGLEGLVACKNEGAGAGDSGRPCGRIAKSLI
jgi:hypothetical protein